jgi:predicted enzyme related to lactoylglutathione lyase
MVNDTLFVIAVPDLQRSAAYYRDVLGFEVREMGDDGWRMFVSGACRIMAGECPDALPPAELGDHSYFAYLVVDRCDDEYARISARGAEFLKAPRDKPWGMREFGVRTVDGHRIMFGNAIATGEA